MTGTTLPSPCPFVFDSELILIRSLVLPPCSRQSFLRRINGEFGGELNLVDPARMFVRESLLTKMSNASNGKKPTDYHFFLFNDLLLYASEGLNTKYVMHRVIHLSLCRLIDYQRTPNGTPSLSFCLPPFPPPHNSHVTLLCVCVNDRGETGHFCVQNCVATKVVFGVRKERQREAEVAGLDFDVYQAGAEPAKKVLRPARRYTCAPAFPFPS
jgi:hypothetical protein